MSRQNTMIFTNMRPPVAAEHGNSPLRGKNVKNIFELANGKYADKAGYRITKDQIVMNYTDDAKLQDSIWNQRHHVTPSNFNIKNTKHYKQYFDKDFRNRDKPLVPNKRELDPFEANEVKGTRMPKYTKLEKQRDIYGELAWDKNHSIKYSKDNTKNYPTTREFFDTQRNYNKVFNATEMTNTDYFRLNAPKDSVARIHRSKRSVLRSMSPHSAKSTNKQRSSTLKKRGGSIVSNLQLTAHGSFYDTPFVLEKDPGNKFKVRDEV